MKKKNHENNPPKIPVWPLVLLGGFLIALALAYLTLHLITPFDNGRVAPRSNGLQAEGVLVLPLPGGPQGFQPNDLVLAAQGRSLEDWTSLALSLNWQPPNLQIGQTIRYQVQRAGEMVAVTVVLGRYPLGQVFQAQWGTILFGLVFLAIAVFIFVRRPDNQPARVLFLTGSSLFCATAWSLGLQLSDFTSGLGLWLYYLCILPGFMLVWISGLHFVLIFPSPLPIVRRRWLLPLVYGLPYTLLVVYLGITRLQTNSNLQWLAGIAFPSDLTAIVCILLAIAVFLIQYRRADSITSRQQVRWLLLATLLVAGSAVLFYFLPPYLGMAAFDPNLTGLIGVLFPLAIAVAILRYNLFDIDLIIRRTLVYGSLTATLSVLFLILVTVLQSLFSLISDQQSPLSVVLSTLAIAALFNPLRNRLQEFIDRRFYRQRYNAEQVVAAFAAQAGNETQLRLLSQMLTEAVIRTMQPENISLWLRAEDEQK